MQKFESNILLNVHQEIIITMTRGKLQRVPLFCFSPVMRHACPKGPIFRNRTPLFNVLFQKNKILFPKVLFGNRTLRKVLFLTIRVLFSILIF
jgi:hypothetical protein